MKLNVLCRQQHEHSYRYIPIKIVEGNLLFNALG